MQTHRQRGASGPSSLLVKVTVVCITGGLLFSLVSVYMHHRKYMRGGEDEHSQVLYGHFANGMQYGAKDGAGVAPASWEELWVSAKAARSSSEFMEAATKSGLMQAQQQPQQGERRQASSSEPGCPPNPACPACAPAAAAASAAATPAAAAPAGNATAQRPARWTDFLSKDSPKDAPPMSGALARSVATNNSVVVTWANFALWDFVQTWVSHVQGLGMSNFLVGAMDRQIAVELVGRGLPCFAMYDVASGANHSGVGSDHLQWGGESFHKMGRQKINLAKLFLGLGLDLLLVDVDIVLLGDVMKYFARVPQADILVTSDQLAATTEPGDDGLELPERAQSPMNIGFMFFRYSERTVKFVASWLDAINADPELWDQNAFNVLAREGWDPVVKVHPDHKRVFIGANGTLAVGVLPVASFSGGHTFFVQKLYEVHRIAPMAVHCTFQYGANPGKRNRLREAMLFEDPPEYYTGERYVSVELSRVPSATWADFEKKNASEMKAYHYRGLDTQLEPVWPAMSIAAVFNRTIIVPRLACYCDRYWTDLDKCRVPGAFQERIPFQCPMDHVLDPFFMVDAASTHVVRWRESSFLDNPRCPATVKRSRLTIYTTKPVKAGAPVKPIERYIVQEGGAVVMLPGNLSQAALKEVMQPYSNYQVWHFKDAAALFGGFDDKALGDEVRKRLVHLQPIVPPDPSPPPSPGAVAAAPPPVANATAANGNASAVANPAASATTAKPANTSATAKTTAAAAKQHRSRE